MNNEFSFTVSKSSGVPVGTYNAVFEGIESFTENSDKYGEGLCLKFRILSGEHKGEEASRIVSKPRKFSAKTFLFKFAKAIAGRDLEDGEAFSFKDHFGVKGMIIVEATEGGSTRVGNFLRAAE
jgi:hypothetical protein